MLTETEVCRLREDKSDISQNPKFCFTSEVRIPNQNLFKGNVGGEPSRFDQMVSFGFTAAGRVVCLFSHRGKNYRSFFHTRS